MHVVGLYVDHQAPALVEFLEEQRQNRYQRALKILDLLEDAGVEVTPLRDEFLGRPEKVLGRPHVARFLQSSGVVQEFQEAFERFLLKGRPAYVGKTPVDPRRGIEVIQAAGGVAVLAHPGLIRNWRRVWRMIRELPWDGLEVYYSEHSEQQITAFQALVDANGWLASGGSDYHGEYGKHASRLGKFGLTETRFHTLKAGATERRAS